MTPGRKNRLSALTRQNLVCFSTADWDTLLPTNKHHLMRRLAARGNRVLYLETLGTRAPSMASGRDWTRIGRRLARSFRGAVKRQKRLWTISPLVRPRWDSPSAIALNRAAFRFQLGPVFPHFRDPIAWVYSPYAVHLVDQVKPRLIVYHMVDDLAAVPGADQETLREAEARLLAKADLVFCTERSLYDRARRINPQSHFMPNVADYRHFSQPEKCPRDPRLRNFRRLPRPRIVFSGHLAPHKVDLGLLQDLARRRPGWEFILIGPIWEGPGAGKQTERLRRRRNVSFFGHVPYEALPPFLHESDVLLIPYVLNEATRAVFPLKAFEYLSTGNPVVASQLPSLEPLRDAVRLAQRPAEWIEAIETALADPQAGRAQRLALARRHTWSHRLQEMDRAIAPFLLS